MHKLNFFEDPLGQSKRHLSNCRSAPGGQFKKGFISRANVGLTQLKISFVVPDAENPAGLFCAQVGPLSTELQPDGQNS
jgi:hypothetical protein